MKFTGATLVNMSTATASLRSGWTSVILRNDLTWSGDSEPRPKPAPNQSWEKISVDGRRHFLSLLWDFDSCQDIELGFSVELWAELTEYEFIMLSGGNSITYKVILKSHCLPYRNRRPQCHSEWGSCNIITTQEVIFLGGQKEMRWWEREQQERVGYFSVAGVEVWVSSKE